jgi:hypothetical protein
LARDAELKQEGRVQALEGELAQVKSRLQEAESRQPAAQLTIEPGPPPDFGEMHVLAKQGRDAEHWFIAVTNAGATGSFRAQTRIERAQDFGLTIAGQHVNGYWDRSAEVRMEILSGLRARIHVGKVLYGSDRGAN